MVTCLPGAAAGVRHQPPEEAGRDRPWWALVKWSRCNRVRFPPATQAPLGDIVGPEQPTRLAAPTAPPVLLLLRSRQGIAPSPQARVQPAPLHLSAG